MGRIRLTGATSGYTELRAASTAGNNTITLPTTNGGEVVVSDSSGNVNIDSGTFYVDATNNRVGVGTSPAYAFHVSQSPNTTGIFLSASSSSTAGDYSQLAFGSTGSAVHAAIRSAYNNPQTGGATSLQFFTNNNSSTNEVARLDSSGRLLVGTSTARDKFNNAASGQDPLVQFEAAGTAAKELYMLSLTANNNSTSSNAGVSLMLARSNGTTLNSYDLVPSGNCIGQIRFQAADGSELVEAANISAFVDGTSGANDMPGRLVFSTTADGASSPTERMRISNNGTIFLNATSLTDGANIQGANAYVGWRFDVGSNSDTLADQNTALCSSVYTSTNTGRATSALLLMSRAGESVGICPLIKGYGGAGASPSTATLQFLVSHNGNVQNTNNSYGSLSDLRLKENIVDAESQWQDIKSLQVRKFNFKNDAAKTPLLGLVAQEVEPISPGLIEQVLQADGTPDPEIPKAIKYSVLYMKAVKALQEAMERIEQLEAKVAALESA